jgi:hypothetical protein
VSAPAIADFVSWAHFTGQPDDSDDDDDNSDIGDGDGGSDNGGGVDDMRLKRSVDKQALLFLMSAPFFDDSWGICDLILDQVM